MEILTNQQGPGPDAGSPLQMEVGAGACLHLHVHPWTVRAPLSAGHLAGKGRQTAGAQQHCPDEGQLRRAGSRAGPPARLVQAGEPVGLGGPLSRRSRMSPDPRGPVSSVRKALP